MKEANNNYTAAEMMIVASAREIQDGDLIFAGVGNPTLGALLACVTHAPNALIATESGCIGPHPKRIILGIGDNAGLENSICTTSLWRLFSDQQRGFVDIGMVGGAQIDKFGNLNSTAIFGGQDYETPVSRLPGSGGANDIASSAKRTVISIPLQRRRFMERVDYITSPGFLEGGNSREKAGLLRGGPCAVITDKCIFRFDEETKEMMLDSVHPGYTVEDIQAEVPWKLKVSDEIKETAPPSDREQRLIKMLDPKGIYTGNGLRDMGFEEYLDILNNSLESFSR